MADVDQLLGLLDRLVEGDTLTDQHLRAYVT
jgi:hypothetical protein